VRLQASQSGHAASSRDQAFAGAAHAITPSPTPEEAAAIMAAVGRFMRASASAGGARGDGGRPLGEEALLEGCSVTMRTRRCSTLDKYLKSR